MTLEIFMKVLKGKAFWFLAVTLIVLAGYAGNRLVVQGVYSWHRTTPEYHGMVAEMVLVFCILSVIFYFCKNKKVKFLGAAGISAVFIWCHVVFLPMVVSFVYLAYIFAFGYIIRKFLLQVKVNEAYCADFLLGCAGVITVFCMMSAAGVGEIHNLKLFVAVTGGFMAACFIWKRAAKGKKGELQSSAASFFTWNWQQALILAFIVTMVLVQAGRMNISVDHDTLWYSVRSEYMLDNGSRGIYENMGTVSLVYTYSKGWEVLTLPLSDLPSHSYLLSFNLWITVISLFAVYRLAVNQMDKKYALLVPFIMSGIPGIMNTSISGKTDNITLLFQLILIIYMTEYLRDKRFLNLLLGFGALLISWTLKSTAIVFSTAVFGAGGLYLIFTRQLNLRASIKEWLTSVPCIIALSLIWYRTFLFVGVPATSIFSGIFQKIGFQIKYPFLVWDLPGYGKKATFAEELLQLAKRLFGVFVLPDSDDMSRVLISWCSLAIVFFLLVWIVFVFSKKTNKVSEERKNQERYQRLILIVLILASVYSIYSLKQVDGNYFILLYTMIILAGCKMISRFESRQFRKQLTFLLVPLTLFNWMMISFTNLAWSVGFTPIQLKNPGYYNHEQLEYQSMVEKGNEEIWKILSADPENRVIAFGNHPEVLAFPCNVQSYVDISSSSGNEFLVENKEVFKEYMRYAKTDYVYVEAGNMAKEYQGYKLLRDSIKAGILVDVRSEHGNIIASVKLDGKPGPEADYNLNIFDDFYSCKGGD